MLCEDCGKNAATMHFVVMGMGGHKSTISLCGECARARQQALFGALGLDMTSLLSGIWSGSQAATGVQSGKTCDKCGMSAGDIAREGKVGCANCYVAFQDVLEPLLRRIHGRARHVGKIPGRAGAGLKVQRELDQLREEQKVAIEREAFEDAARIRDQIRALEAQLSAHAAEDMSGCAPEGGARDE